MEYPLILFGTYLILFIFLLFTVGHISFSILNLQITGEYSKVFSKLVSGIFIIIFFYSIYKTNFHTITSGFIIAGLLLWWNRGFRLPSMKKAYQIFTDNEIKDQLFILLQLCIVALLILAWNHHFMFSGNVTIVENPHPDLSFYARVSSFLNGAGKETFEMNYLEPQTLGATPYHYFELWGNAFVSFLFHNPSTLATIQLISIPAFLTLVISGVWALMEQVKINLFYKLLSIALLFITGFYFPVYDSIHLYWTSYFQVNLLDQSTGLKTSILYIAILMFTLLLVKKKYQEALVCLLFFPFASVYGMFTFIPSCVILSIYFFSIKKINFASAIKIIIGAMIATIYFQLFYKLNSDKEFYSNMVDILTVIHQLLELSVRSRIIIATEKFIELLILYSPLILLFPLLINHLKSLNNESKANLTDIFIGFCCFILTSLISWNFFYFVFGSSEFFYTITNTVMNVSVFMLIYFFFIFNKNLLVRGCLVLYISIFILFQVKKINDVNNSFSNTFREKHSIEYVNAIDTLNIGKQGACLLSQEEALTIHVNPFYYQNAPYFHYSKPDCEVTNISIYDIPGGEAEIDKHAKITFIHGSPFFRFIQSQKKTGLFESIKKSQIQFIEYYNIRFLIISKNFEPDSLLKIRLKKEIKDERSGEKFWILK